MLVLKNADMEGLVTMAQVVSELEVAYVELGRDVAKNAPRARLYVPAEQPDTKYFFNNIMGAVPGSGVMALLSVKLGAGRVCGTENDPVALEAARRGAELNGLAPDRIWWALTDPDELPAPPYRIVVANILLNTLVELAPAIARKVARGGRLVLSGLLPPQAGEAEAAYAAQGLVPAGHTERDGWIRVELSRA